MSQHRMEIVIVVDDEALAEHDSDTTPPADLSEWDGRDIPLAWDASLIEEIEVVGYEQLPDTD